MGGGCKELLAKQEIAFTRVKHLSKGYLIESSNNCPCYAAQT